MSHTCKISVRYQWIARIRSEVVWNSTANLLGKPGHNIALDLVNEFLNNEFKGRRPLIKK